MVEHYRQSRRARPLPTRRDEAALRTLLLLRHGKSSWDDPSLDDHDRPLAKRGKRDAPRIGRLLLREGLVPDRILTSTAVRALKTARAVAKACAFDGPLLATSDLYLAETEGFRRVLREVPNESGRVLVVSHNPGLELLLEALTGRQETLPTAALARVDLPIRRWNGLRRETRGTLIALWRPREIPD